MKVNFDGLSCDKIFFIQWVGVVSPWGVALDDTSPIQWREHAPSGSSIHCFVEAVEKAEKERERESSLHTRTKSGTCHQSSYLRCPIDPELFIQSSCLTFCLTTCKLMHILSTRRWPIYTHIKQYINDQMIKLNITMQWMFVRSSTLLIDDHTTHNLSKAKAKCSHWESAKLSTLLIDNRDTQKRRLYQAFAAACALGVVMILTGCCRQCRSRFEQ